MFKKFLRFTALESLAFLFKTLGGLYLIKYLFRDKKILIVLNYHSFSLYNNSKIRNGDIEQTGYSKNFNRQIRFFKKHFTFTYPETFFNKSEPDGIFLLLTFDDGYKDNFDVAYPILKNNSVKAIFFLATAYINTNNWLWHDKVRFLINKGYLKKEQGEEQLKILNSSGQICQEFKNKINKLFVRHKPSRIMLTWQEVAEMHKQGFRFGAHTHNHAILSNLSQHDQIYELQKSMSVIEKELGRKCNYVAYPNGQFNDNTLTLLNDLNIEYGFSTISGMNYKDNHKYKIKRIGLNPSDSLSKIYLKFFIGSLKK